MNPPGSEFGHESSTVEFDDAVTLWIPDGIHSLGLELPEEERAERVDDLADGLWSAGTDFQRETVATWYREFADSAADDGALYAGVCFVATENEQPGSATLLIRAETADSSDAELAVTGLVEALSADPAKEVFRTTAAGRPAVVVFSATTTVLSQSAGQPATELTIATAEAYIPLPEISRLLVLNISSPSLELFPDFASLLSGIAETTEVDRAAVDDFAAEDGTATRVSTAGSVSSVFG